MEIHLTVKRAYSVCVCVCVRARALKKQATKKACFHIETLFFQIKDISFWCPL